MNLATAAAAARPSYRKQSLRLHWPAAAAAAARWQSGHHSAPPLGSHTKFCLIHFKRRRRRVRLKVRRRPPPRWAQSFESEEREKSAKAAPATVGRKRMLLAREPAGRSLVIQWLAAILALVQLVSACQGAGGSELKRASSSLLPGPQANLAPQVGAGWAEQGQVISIIGVPQAAHWPPPRSTDGSPRGQSAGKQSWLARLESTTRTSASTSEEPRGRAALEDQGGATLLPAININQANTKAEVRHRRQLDRELGGVSASTNEQLSGANEALEGRRSLEASGAAVEATSSGNGSYSPSSSYSSGANSNANANAPPFNLSHLEQEQASQRRLMELKQKYTSRTISDTAYYILLAVYSLFILIGTALNSLICLTVILKPKILSPRNIFIVNLACSDLLLCVFTMPFSFIEISMRIWQMGLVPCKLVAGLQATSIFVSTISITAIALDRYKVIVYPTHQEAANGTRRGTALLLASVWIGALLLSLPLFRFRTLEHLELPNREAMEFCVELWPFAHGRGIYSVISMIFQYVLPITIVSVVYAKISDKLKKRLIRRQRLTQLECQQKRQLNLIKRTHTMLISVSLIFGLSWLPLNLLNVIGDFSDLLRGDDQLFRLVFAACHLIGCSSACSNPILYGYLNENFRKELNQVYTHHMHRLLPLYRRLCCRVGRDSGGAGEPGESSPQATPTSITTSDDSNDCTSCDEEGATSNSDSSGDTNLDDLESGISGIMGTGNPFSRTISSRSPSSGSAVTASDHALFLKSACGVGVPEASAVAVANKHQRQQMSLTNSGNISKLADGTSNNNINSSHHQTATNEPANLKPGVASRSGSVPGARLSATVASTNAELGRISFQTITSSRPTLGRTMRLCFCLSGSSSAETIGPPAGECANQRHGSNATQRTLSRLDRCALAAIESGRRWRRSSSQVLGGGGGSGSRQASYRSSAHGASGRAQSPLGGERHKSRPSTRLCSSSSHSCQCQCHTVNSKAEIARRESARAAAGERAGSLRRAAVRGSSMRQRITKVRGAGRATSTGSCTGMGVANSSGNSNNKDWPHCFHDSQATQRPRLSLAALGESGQSRSGSWRSPFKTRRASSALPDGGAVVEEHELQLQQGRRVWLRFFPAKHSEPSGAQQQQQQPNQNPASAIRLQVHQISESDGAATSDRNNVDGAKSTKRRRGEPCDQQLVDAAARPSHKGSRKGSSKHCANCRPWARERRLERKRKRRQAKEAHKCGQTAADNGEPTGGSEPASGRIEGLQVDYDSSTAVCVAAAGTALAATAAASFRRRKGNTRPVPLGTCYLSVESARRRRSDVSVSKERSTELVVLNLATSDSTDAASVSAADLCSTGATSKPEAPGESTSTVLGRSEMEAPGEQETRISEQLLPKSNDDSLSSMCPKLRAPEQTNSSMLIDVDANNAPTKSKNNNNNNNNENTSSDNTNIHSRHHHNPPPVTVITFDAELAHNLPAAGSVQRQESVEIDLELGGSNEKQSPKVAGPKVPPPGAAAAELGQSEWPSDCIQATGLIQANPCEPARTGSAANISASSALAYDSNSSSCACFHSHSSSCTCSSSSCHLDTSVSSSTGAQGDASGEIPVEAAASAWLSGSPTGLGEVPLQVRTSSPNCSLPGPLPPLHMARSGEVATHQAKPLAAATLTAQATSSTCSSSASTGSTSTSARRAAAKVATAAAAAAAAAASSAPTRSSHSSQNSLNDEYTCSNTSSAAGSSSSASSLEMAHIILHRASNMAAAPSSAACSRDSLPLAVARAPEPELKLAYELESNKGPASIRQHSLDSSGCSIGRRRSSGQRPVTVAAAAAATTTTTTTTETTTTAPSGPRESSTNRRDRAAILGKRLAAASYKPNVQEQATPNTVHLATTKPPDANDNAQRPACNGLSPTGGEPHMTSGATTTTAQQSHSCKPSASKR